MLKTKPLVARRFELMALEHIERRAERMRERRKELGLTQEEVADRMQETHRDRHPDGEPDHTRGQMVSDWERAVNEPSAPKLELLAAALEWTVGDLNTDSRETVETPDVLGELSEGAQLDRIEEKLDVLLKLVRDQAAEDVEADLSEPAEPQEHRQGGAVDV